MFQKHIMPAPKELKRRNGDEKECTARNFFDIRTKQSDIVFDVFEDVHHQHKVCLNGGTGAVTAHAISTQPAVDRHVAAIGITKGKAHAGGAVSGARIKRDHLGIEPNLCARGDRSLGQHLADLTEPPARVQEGPTLRAAAADQPANDVLRG